MKYTGTITRIQHDKAGVTIIIDTEMGLRGVEVDRELWLDILTDFDLQHDTDLVGWVVEYDPARGDLEITGPQDDDSA